MPENEEEKVKTVTFTIPEDYEGGIYVGKNTEGGVVFIKSLIYLITL